MRLRKILMVASVTFACVAQAQDLTIHVNKKGKVGFVDKNGAEVINSSLKFEIMAKQLYVASQRVL